MSKYIWTFIVAVALADVYFTWTCRSSVLEWESNPVASFACRQAGLWGAVLLRTAALAFAALIARLRSRFGWLITPICGVAHAYLLAVLAQSFLYLPALAG